MSSNQWQRIEELFHAALHLPECDRPTFLNSECNDDPTLREEVMSLIAASELNENFIEDPALSLGFKVLSSTATKSLLNQSVGHYKLHKLLGSGGMGDVYLADDCTLGRRVALKFLSRSLVDDDWAKSQLLKEARAIAQLENPNICTIHGLEEIDEHNFIVMQYVEGETLHSLMKDGPLELDRVLDFAEQIASALSSAHQRSIIHRDVKPQNIVVTPEGLIKVLDFGLAKFVKPPEGTTLSERKADQTSLAAGVVGTVAYMSPEQTRGEELDSRSDIFSFGIVLYEMLSGRNPFIRDSKSETLLALQEDEPVSLPRAIPKRLNRIVSRCLRKNPIERYGTTQNLLVEIYKLREKRKHTPAAYVRQLRMNKHFRLYAAAVLGFLLCAVLSAGFVYSKLSRVHRIAVLPISNQTGDSNLNYLSVGLTRNLYDKLSYLPRLHVRLPSVTSEQSQIQTEELVRLGKDLRVESVLSGEIVKQGQSLVLHLRVINSMDATEDLDSFSIDPTNLFALQNDILDRATSALGLWLIGDERKLLTKRQTDNEEALHLFMRGRVYLGLKRDRENIKAAIDFFQRAIELDPSFAKAHAGLADCYALRGNVLYGPMKPKDTMELARYHAQQALDVEPLLPEAHTSMAVIKMKYDWDWAGAEREFKLALRLNPEYAPAHYWYSNLLVVLGRFDEAINESQRAKDLDPYSPLAAMNYGRALYFARRYQESADYFGKLLEDKVDYPQYLHMRGLSLIQLHQYDEAVTLLERLHSIDALHTAAALGFAYGKSNRLGDALRMIDELDRLAKDNPVPPHEKAFVSIGLDKKDEAFSLLEEAYQERFEGLIYLTSDSIYDDLRGDGRFTDLARRVNLVQ